MKTVYVTIKVVVEDTVDTDELASEMDYTIAYPGVVSTEVVSTETR